MSSSTASELDSLPGLDSAKRVVMGLAVGSGVHSVLFYGMEGSGKKRLAQILARAWLCTRKLPPSIPHPPSSLTNQSTTAGQAGVSGSDSGLGDGSTPQPPSSLTNQSEEWGCGVCQVCVAFERGRAADLLWISPAGASRNIKLGAISPVQPDDDDYPVSAQQFLRTPPLSARNKVVVIEDADRLLPRAANSLLKVLEEPPPYGRFILLTDSVGSILPTILSRCVAVACELPSELTGFEPWAVALASGAPERAREIQEQSGVYRPIYDFAMGLGGRSRGEGLVASEEFAELAEGIQAALKSGARAANVKALEVLATAYALSPDQRANALHSIVETHRRVQGNANAGPAFDALFAAIVGR